MNASLLIGRFSCLPHDGNGNNLHQSEAHNREEEGVSRNSSDQSQRRRDCRSRSGAALRRGCVYRLWGKEQ